MTTEYHLQHSWIENLAWICQKTREDISLEISQHIQQFQEVYEKLFNNKKEATNAHDVDVI